MLSNDSLARLRTLAAEVHADPAIDVARADTLALGVVQLLDDLAEERSKLWSLRSECDSVGLALNAMRQQRDALRTAAEAAQEFIQGYFRILSLDDWQIAREFGINTISEQLRAAIDAAQ